MVGHYRVRDFYVSYLLTKAHLKGYMIFVFFTLQHAVTVFVWGGGGGGPRWSRRISHTQLSQDSRKGCFPVGKGGERETPVIPIKRPAAMAPKRQTSPARAARPRCHPRRRRRRRSRNSPRSTPPASTGG
jgi:hypothetical protein